MLAAVYDEKKKQYIRQMTIIEIDHDNLIRAHEFFENYKERKVILNNSFNDDVWVLSNQTEKYSISFKFSESIFSQNAMDWMACDCNCYQNCAKAYIVFNLGALSLKTLNRIGKELTELAESSLQEALKPWEFTNHIIELLKIIPESYEERDYVIEELEEKQSYRKQQQKGNGQRALADFNSYLKFEELINEFWQYASEEKRVFYFPLYFWWRLTSILPLRPIEFLLTPRNCLETNDNGENILTIRRTKLKGGNEKITYRIEGDYECKKYIIPEGLAQEVHSYIQLTEKMQQAGLDTLITREPYCKYVKNSMQIPNRFYSYSDLSTTLEYFYTEYIKNKKDDIGVIRLGDTRHIAMVSLIISGGSPVICKELAGHSDINISSHYYTNISNMVECMTLDRYRKLKGKTARLQGKQRYNDILPLTKHRVSNGWCDALNVKNGDITECIKVVDDEGHIGSCNCCCHYWPDLQGIRLEIFDEHKGKSKIDLDCRFLMRIIELTRKGIGCTEDIEKALLRLQRSSNHYSRCLWEKYMGTEEQ